MAPQTKGVCRCVLLFALLLCTGAAPLRRGGRAAVASQRRRFRRDSAPAPRAPAFVRGAAAAAAAAPLPQLQRAVALRLPPPPPPPPPSSAFHRFVGVGTLVGAADAFIDVEGDPILFGRRLPLTAMVRNPYVAVALLVVGLVVLALLCVLAYYFSRTIGGAARWVWAKILAPCCVVPWNYGAVPSWKAGRQCVYSCKQRTYRCIDVRDEYYHPYRRVGGMERRSRRFEACGCCGCE